MEMIKEGCPRCGRFNTNKIKDRKKFHCNDCCGDKSKKCIFNKRRGMVGKYYDKDCRRGHVINWSKTYKDEQTWKCERCKKLFVPKKIVRCPKCKSENVGYYENLMGGLVDYCKDCEFASGMGFT